MQAKQLQGKTLHYIAIEPDGYDPARKYPMIILLHGFGAHMGDLASLAPAIDANGYVYIFPNAPIPFEIGPGATGYGWTYPRRIPQELRRADDVDSVVDMLATLVDEVTEHYATEPGEIILGGFSQGGMMTYRYGLPNPGKFKGLVALSAVVPEEDTMRERLPADRSQPIFVAHGTADMVIEVQMARDTREFLLAEGYAPVYHEYPMAHEISQQTLTDLAAWIKNTLPPASLELSE